MNKKDRIARALVGDKVDRVPYGFYGHFPDEENNAIDLSKKLIDFFIQHDMDYLKVHTRFQLFSEIWGCKWHYGLDKFSGPQCVKPVISSEKDLKHFLEILQDRAPIKELRNLIRFIKKDLSNDTPVILTVFSPILVFGTLIGDIFGLDQMSKLIKNEPNKFKKCLSRITEVTIDTLKVIKQEKIDGIYYAAAPFPTANWLDDCGYKEYEINFAKLILSECNDLYFNMLHLSGGDIRIDLIDQLPAHVIHWLTNKPGNPSISEGLKLTKKAISGGTDEQVDFLNSTPDQLKEQTKHAIQESGGRRHIFSILLSFITEKVTKEQFQAVIDGIHNFKNKNI